MKYLIVGHGKYPSGTKSTLKFLSGISDTVTIVEENIQNNSYEDEIDAFLNENTDNEIIVFSDIISGAASQYVMKKLNHRKFKMIAGFNMALLLEIILTGGEGIDLNEVTEGAKEQIVYMNDMFREAL